MANDENFWSTDASFKIVLNLGKAGGGALVANARLREYKHAYNFKPEFVVYLFFSSNDLPDTEQEYNHPLFKKYFNNKKFSQDLKNKQDKVNVFWKKFFTIISKENFAKKHVVLK